MIPVSVLILTLDEEHNLPACIGSVAWAGEVVVLDSLSTDRTVEVARDLGARVVERRFDDWSSHQNWAVDNIRFAHPWVLYLDADEVVDQELAEEIAQIVRGDSRPEVGFFVRRKDMLLGRWLRHASMYPIWILRLFRPERVRWQRAVNPVAVIDGETGRMAGHLIHHNYSKGVSAWVQKHADYARLEAREAGRLLNSNPIDFAGVLAFGDPIRRRKALKEVSFLFPFRPALRFCYMYFLRLGILDGRAGLMHCRLVAFYEYMLELNRHELRYPGREHSDRAGPPAQRP